MFNAYIMFINLVVAKALDAYNQGLDYPKILKDGAREYNLQLFDVHNAFNYALKERNNA